MANSLACRYKYTYLNLKEIDIYFFNFKRLIMNECKYVRCPSFFFEERSNVIYTCLNPKNIHKSKFSILIFVEG